MVFALLSQTSCPYACGFISGLCCIRLVCWSVFTSVPCCFYHGFIIPTIGWNRLSNSVLRNCSILGPLRFHMDFRISLSVFVKRSLLKLRLGPRWARGAARAGGTTVWATSGFPGRGPGAASLVSRSSPCSEALHGWCVFHRLKAGPSSSRKTPTRSGRGPNPRRL